MYCSRNSKLLSFWTHFSFLIRKIFCPSLFIVFLIELLLWCSCSLAYSMRKMMRDKALVCICGFDNSLCKDAIGVVILGFIFTTGPEALSL